MWCHCFMWSIFMNEVIERELTEEEQDELKQKLFKLMRKFEYDSDPAYKLRVDEFDKMLKVKKI